MSTNQYSVTEYFQPVHKGEQKLPAVWFMYDMSPILVTVHEARFSLGHLLVRLCAVIGGVFAVTGEVPENLCLKRYPRLSWRAPPFFDSLKIFNPLPLCTSCLLRMSLPPYLVLNSLSLLAGCANGLVRSNSVTCVYCFALWLEMDWKPRSQQGRLMDHWTMGAAVACRHDRSGCAQDHDFCL